MVILSDIFLSCCLHFLLSPFSLLFPKNSKIFFNQPLQRVINRSGMADFPHKRHTHTHLKNNIEREIRVMRKLCFFSPSVLECQTRLPCGPLTPRFLNSHNTCTSRHIESVNRTEGTMGRLIKPLNNTSASHILPRKKVWFQSDSRQACPNTFLNSSR